MINKIINYIKEPLLKIIYVDNSVNVINYDKILEIRDDLVTILSNKSKILIRGSNLKLKKLLDNEVLITGLINKIEM